jgi:hypothetical protein
MRYETKNPNLIKLLESFGYKKIFDVANPSLEKFCFDIPEDSVLYPLLQESSVLNFLQKEEKEFQKRKEAFYSQKEQTSPITALNLHSKFPYYLLSALSSAFGSVLRFDLDSPLPLAQGLQSQPTEGPAMDHSKPAFADLARLLGRVTAFSGVQHWAGARDMRIAGTTTPQQSLGFLIRGFFKQRNNINASIPGEYTAIAVTSEYNKLHKYRFGDSGLTLDLRGCILFGPTDFGSVYLGDLLDPSKAYENYNPIKFERTGLAYYLSSATKQISSMFFRTSVDQDPQVQDVREGFAKDKNKAILSIAIATIKGFFRPKEQKEAEYNEMHFPAGILLTNGYFCTDSLTQASLDEYKKLIAFREFLSAEDNATQQQELLDKMFTGTTERQKHMLSNPQQMREKYLTDYAKYFEDIVSSHKKRVDKLMKQNEIEEALVLAIQADYFSQFTTIQGVRNQLKKPLDLTVFHSQTKEQDKIEAEELSRLLSFDLKNIIDSDLVKPEDKEDFKRILHHLDIREINKFFQRTDSSTAPTFPEKILTNEKLDLSKFLQDEETQDSLEVYHNRLIVDITSRYQSSEEDVEYFKQILQNLDVRTLNNFFPREATPNNPRHNLVFVYSGESSTQKKLYLLKFLRHKEIKELLKPYFDELLKNIVDSDFVKEIDKEEFRDILSYLDIRDINKFFQRTDSLTAPTFPSEILDQNGKLDLSKFLENDLAKPYRTYLYEDIASYSNIVRCEDIIEVERHLKYSPTAILHEISKNRDENGKIIPPQEIIGQDLTIDPGKLAAYLSSQNKPNGEVTYPTSCGSFCCLGER